jgi:predicted lipoprotein with Yx(FWY)xxD motif
MPAGADSFWTRIPLNRFDLAAVCLPDTTSKKHRTTAPKDHEMRRIRVAVLAGATTLGLALTACGGTGAGPDQADQNTSGRFPRPAATTKLAAADTATLGTVVTDAHGRTLYRFDNDTAEPPKSTCLAECAAQWPPALVGKGENVGLAGVDQHLVGSVARPDGTLQLTLAGWPLYLFAKDKQAGETLGHGVSGVWFAATPEGTRAKATQRNYQPQQPQQHQQPEQPEVGYGY